MRCLWPATAWALLGFVTCAAGLVPAADASAAALPVGRWFTADHSAVVQIAPCGTNLCGQIVGIALAHAGDPMPMDWEGRPQCGETILETSRVADDNTGGTNWVGQVLDPRNGNVYQATIALDAARHLLLRGYLGLPIFGQTQTWDPYPGRTLADCRLAEVTASTG